MVLGTLCLISRAHLFPICNKQFWWHFPLSQLEGCFGALFISNYIDRLHVKCLCSKCIICCKIVMSFMIALYPAWASWSPSVPRERLLLIVSVDPTLWIRARVLESLYFILPHEFYKHLHKNVLLNIIHIYISIFFYRN